MPIVLTSFDDDVPGLRNSDLKRRVENKKPASLWQVYRFVEEDGNEVADLFPRRSLNFSGISLSQ